MAESKSQTLAQDAYQRIKADVISCVFEPEQRLRIEDLRKTYETGASPLREALSRLAAEGLVVSIGQRGFRVPAVSIDELRDITDTRVLIETAALRESIEHGNDDWEAGVVAAFHHLTKFESGNVDDFESWEKANKRFHDSLLAACPSRWLLRFHETMYDQHRRYRAMSLQAVHIPRSVHEEHTRIRDAALARDVKRACAESENHIRQTAKITEKLFSEKDSPTEPSNQAAS